MIRNENDLMWATANQLLRNGTDVLLEHDTGHIYIFTEDGRTAIANEEENLTTIYYEPRLLLTKVREILSKFEMWNEAKRKVQSL